MGTLIVRRDGPVLSLELSNPGKSNALDLAILTALDEQVSRVEQDASVRVVVLQGTAGGSFSSGADIREWSAMAPDAFARDWIAHGNMIFRRFERLRCPSVAVIEGLCFGGGLELALCCDLRVATGAARLRFPEVAIGAIPGWEGGTRLERVVGRGRALEAVLLSQEIDASTAERWGVLNVVWPCAALADMLAELTGRLCQVSPQAAAIAKSLIVGDTDRVNDGANDSFAAHTAAARQIRSSRDAEIGIHAFFDKKTAVFLAS